MKVTFPITRKQFGNYIATAHGAKFRRRDDERCPLTRAIQAYHPKAKNDIRTGPSTVGSYDPLPQWASKFIDLYDAGKTARQAAVLVGAIRRA